MGRGSNLTSLVCDDFGSIVIAWPTSAHEKAGAPESARRTDAGRMPSLTSWRGSVFERPTSSLGKAMTGRPSSVRAAGCATSTCGKVPSPTTSKVSSFVAGSTPCSTAASKVA